MAPSPSTPRRKPRRPPRARGPLRQGAGRVLGFLARLVRGLLAAAVLVALVAGLPWALTHFVGWPLPDHLPSWAEIQGVLLGPMTTTFLLDFLACLTWLVWAFFALDVARCAVEIAHDARMPDLSAAGPMHRIAAVLVGAVLISILGQRAGLPAASPSAAGGAATEVVATAPAWSTPAEHGAFAVVRPAAYSTPYHLGAAGVVEQPSRAKSAVVLPYNPGTGVHDSLWRMSERTLGDGNRWPEIYALNQGKPQPDGGTFTNPGLIFPGEEMALPDDATAGSTPPTVPVPPPPPAPPEPPPTSTTTPAPSTTQPPATTEVPHTTQASPATQTPPSTDPAGEPGFSWGEELFVGLGLAAAVSAALVAARRRNRRRYRPGSGDRSDLPVAPVVYQLRLAHLRADHAAAADDVDLDWPSERPPRVPVPPVVLGARARTPDAPGPVLPVGVRDGREIAVDLAATHGLGLLGAGAPAAVRALLVAMLSKPFVATHGSATVIVPADDLAALFGRRVAQAQRPDGLQVAADLDAALDMLESETLVRVGQHPPHGQAWGPVVLAARTPGRQTRRLQAVLDNGATIGVTGLLLGQWSAGVTAYVRDDGTISTTSPGLGEPLRGARVFGLGDDHTADLLNLLSHAHVDDESEFAGVPGDEPHLAPRPHIVVDDSMSATVEPAGTVVDRGTTIGGREHVVAEDTLGEGTTQGPVAEMDLELLATLSDDDRQGDGELEILGPTPTTSPGLRLRPVQPGRTQADQPHHSQAGQSADDDHRLGRQPGSDQQSPAEPREAVFTPLRVAVLGPPRVWWTTAPATPDGEATEREITSAFQPRLRELLVFLALHPDGASREALIAALWATSPPERTTNAMNTSLSRLRRALAAATGGVLSDLVVVGEGRYRLDPELVEVDYHHFAAAVAARRSASTDTERVAAYRRIVDSYAGPLADGMSTDWIETAREAIRRDAIDTVAALARALIEDDPQQTLDLLEIARAFDPHNELIYRDIMRLQERLGQLDAIPRTLTLLTTRLAEVDDHPTHQAVDLAARLRRRHEAPGEPARADRGRSRAG
ncbi:BTAD domain-containing putative transcriptional regulator [Umezawaea sp. Da 62-37]|uniref:BTAD domain-containing putative transcriptional regulator n=1 Tax=Umezawaea sp. Da 62-37 TaxID=3075927 RepID=UPI0028F6C28F|nr:BTAD domain-containing putative transcriptional regulator [Umezawaea sp. Da 62-37]WNV90210.1 BTAD domain-containing putative transcriptional regulator [Umezawaea sp. Da 62-37]